MLPLHLRMRRVKWIQFYHNFDLLDRCRLIANPLSTAATCQRQLLNKSTKLKLKSDAFESQKQKYEDTFGNLESFQATFMKIKEDSEDVKDYKRDRAAQGKKIPQYIKEVAEHLQKKDYKSALKVLEVDMRNDRKPPVSSIYTDMIMYNARIGNLEEAYRLYTNFKKFGGKPCRAMYTVLFAACQTSRNRELALKAATAIREYLMNDQNIKPNNTHYRAMIIAFGKQGDLATCFKIFDEFMYKRDKFNADDFHAMFNAFLNDQNAGLRHALLFWRKMIQYRVQPNLDIFHTLLHCVKNCSLGDVELLPDLIKEIDEQSKVFVRTKVKIKTINNEKRRTVLKIPADGKIWYSKLKPPDFEKKLEILKKHANVDVDFERVVGGNTEIKNTLLISPESQSQNITTEGISEVEIQSNSEKQEKEISIAMNDQKPHSNLPEITPTFTQLGFPNLLAFEPTLGCVLKFKALMTPQHRFILFGGLSGFLKVMFEFGINPTAKTLTQLLCLIPEKKEAHEEVLNLARALNIKLDTEFFNALLKIKIFMGEDFNCVQKYLQLMQEEKLQPDLLTFGTLALACVDLNSASQLVKSICSFGFRLNIQICGALLNKAVFAGDLEYVKGVLDIVKKYEVQVDGKFIAKLVNFVEKHKHLKDTKALENKLYTYSSS